MISEDERKALVEAIQRNPAYRLAYEDADLMKQDDLRAMRLQLELIKPERALRRHAVRSTVVVFGSARIVSPDTAQRQIKAAQAQGEPASPKAQRDVAEAERQVRLSRYYVEARRFAELVSLRFQQEERRDFVVAEGMISPHDCQLFTLVETADQAIAALVDFYHGQPPDAPQNEIEGVA